MDFIIKKKVQEVPKSPQITVNKSVNNMENLDTPSKIQKTVGRLRFKNLQARSSYMNTRKSVIVDNKNDSQAKTKEQSPLLFHDYNTFDQTAAQDT